MAYLSKQAILIAYSKLANLTDDPSAQGATQVTSAIRYLLALDNFYKRFGRSCDTSKQEDRNLFIEFVGTVVAISDNYYTVNFYNSFKQSLDFSIGSNFFSVNAVKSSTINPKLEFKFPKRGNFPLFIIKNGELIEKQELLPNIDHYLHNLELKTAFTIWLARYAEVNPNSFYEDLKLYLSTCYSEKLVSLLIPNESDIDLSQYASFCDKTSSLIIDDFQKSNGKVKSMQVPLLPANELSKKVRESFELFLELTNKQMENRSVYIGKLDIISSGLNSVFPEIVSIFQIVSARELENKIEALIKTDSSYEPLLSPKYQKKDNIDYFTWTIFRQYLNYLTILEKSDFRANIDDGIKKVFSVESENVDNNIKMLLLAMRTKPFLLLAGISGTGKSRIVKQMAFESCPKIEQLRNDMTVPGNYELIEVKPNWHDSTELLGYESEIGGQHYVLTPFVRFLVKAMRFQDKAPFFVCMDEMNLAPVEQYFAEFLSVLESRQLLNEDKGGVITSEPLIKAEIFAKYENTLKDELFGIKRNEPKNYESATEDKNVEYGDFNNVYDELKKNGLRLPSNLIVIGTVNMDETTHQFSRKVIDRAMTIEMNIKDDEQPFKEFFNEKTLLEYKDKPVDKKLFLPKVVQASEVLLILSEDDATYLKENVPHLLYKLNLALNNTPFKVAYRVQNELVLYFYSLREEKLEESAEDLLKLAFDAILMMKVLPRIEGDEDLLKEPLKELEEFTQYYPESHKKIEEMIARLDRVHFTSFWP